VLRATFATQQVAGPGRRLSISPTNGLIRVQLDQWPVLEVIGASYVLNNSFPRTYTTIPSNNIDLEYLDATVSGSPIIGGNATGPTAMIIGGGVSGYAGGSGYRVQAQYVAGFPHAGITAAVAEDDLTISVDDVTGYGIATVDTPIGATIPDGANTEVIEVTGVTANNGSVGASAYGPGTLTVPVEGIAFTHTGPVDNIPSCLITTMPFIIGQAALQIAMNFALLRGSTATTVPRQPGSAQNTGGSNWSIVESARELLAPFRRVV
jgi:hypothetical protein